MNIKQVIAVAAALALTTSAHAGAGKDGKCSKSSCSKKEMSTNKEGSCSKMEKEGSCSKMEKEGSCSKK